MYNLEKAILYSSSKEGLSKDAFKFMIIVTYNPQNNEMIVLELYLFCKLSTSMQIKSMC